MFVIMENYTSCEGTFSTHVGHTSDEEIAKTFVEHMNSLNEKENDAHVHFLRVTYPEWKKQNPEPNRKNYGKNEEKYLKDMSEWQNKERDFFKERGPLPKYDKDIYWTYEKSHEISLEMALGIKEFVRD